MKDETQPCYFNWPEEKEENGFHRFIEKAKEQGMISVYLQHNPGQKVSWRANVNL